MEQLDDIIKVPIGEYGGKIINIEYDRAFWNSKSVGPTSYPYTIGKYTNDMGMRGLRQEFEKWI